MHNSVDANKLIEAIEQLISDIGIDNSDIVVKDEDLQDIVLRSQEEAKLTGCPRPFSDDEVRDIILSLVK